MSSYGLGESLCCIRWISNTPLTIHSDSEPPPTETGEELGRLNERTQEQSRIPGRILLTCSTLCLGSHPWGLGNGNRGHSSSGSTTSRSQTCPENCSPCRTVLSSRKPVLKSNRPDGISDFPGRKWKSTKQSPKSMKRRFKSGHLTLVREGVLSKRQTLLTGFKWIRVGLG